MTQSTWNLAGAAHTGASHLRHRIGCQDSARYLHHPYRGSHAVIAAVADGAGSSPHAAMAASLATKHAIRSAQDDLATFPGPPITAVNYALPRAFDAAHRAIAERARHDRNPIRDYHTTLLMFIIAQDTLGAAQIGDGAIVGQQKDQLPQLITHPQQGEYANETRFITDANYRDYAQFPIHQAHCWSAAAVFSDGLQRLLLDYSNPDQPTPHLPFFARNFPAVAAMPGDYDRFLTINNLLKRVVDSGRSHDDLSLVIAARRKH